MLFSQKRCVKAHCVQHELRRYKALSYHPELCRFSWPNTSMKRGYNSWQPEYVSDEGCTPCQASSECSARLVSRKLLPEDRCSGSLNLPLHPSAYVEYSPMSRHMKQFNMPERSYYYFRHITCTHMPIWSSGR